MDYEFFTGNKFNKYQTELIKLMVKHKLQLEAQGKFQEVAACHALIKKIVYFPATVVQNDDIAMKVKENISKAAFNFLMADE